jgi:hypothetical protein
MFMFDIETLGVESTSVILSVGMVHFDVNGVYKYDDLIERGLFVKFSVKDQVENYNRTVDKSTIEWWGKQNDFARKTNFQPSKNDLTVIDGLGIINAYIEKHRKDKNETFWSRGSLDQVCIDSLCKSAGQELITFYNNWRDIRTAIDLLAVDAKNGYCSVKHPTFVRDDVCKHHPVHDCALDIFMLLYHDKGE